MDWKIASWLGRRSEKQCGIVEFLQSDKWRRYGPGQVGVAKTGPAPNGHRNGAWLHSI